VSERAFVLLFALLMHGMADSAPAEIRDPTRPPRRLLEAAQNQDPQQEAAPPRLSLQSILVGQGRRLALIDGKLLTEGQSIEGAEVLRIDPSGVEMRFGDKNFLLQPPRTGMDPKRFESSSRSTQP